MDEYKNILWIEDGDTNDRKAAPTNDFLDNESADDAASNAIDYELIQEYFGTTIASGVELITKYRLALDKLKDNCYEYDLIVFDLDFGKDEDIQDEGNFYKILSLLKDGHVNPVGENRDPKIFKTVAGYYLYLFLAMKGFPTDRMVILTGNSENYIGRGDGDSDKKHPDIFLKFGSDIIEKKHNSKWIEQFYSKDGSRYYRLRRLINQACHYWIAQLKSSLKDAEKIPFNKLYYTREVKDRYKSDKPDKPYKPYKPLKTAITSDAFINMLEHIRMLFPVTCPSTPEKVYYQAMRTLSAFHEESAKIQDIGKIKNSSQEYKASDFANLKRFHSCIRNFRNWSSHNLMETELMAEKFALLFCIGVRTYFSWETESDLNSELLPYEELYDFNRDEKSDPHVLPTVLSVWHEIHEQLNSLIQQNNQNYYHYIYYSDLEEAVRKLGEQGRCHDMSRFLFVPIWCPKPKTGMTQGYGSKEQKRDFLIKYKLTEDDCIKFYNDSHVNKTSVRSRFMDYCYQWIRI